MDLQPSTTPRTKQNIFSRLTVAFCLILTAALLISSLNSPGRAFPKDKTATTKQASNLSR